VTEVISGESYAAALDQDKALAIISVVGDAFALGAELHNGGIAEKRLRPSNFAPGGKYSLPALRRLQAMPPATKGQMNRQRRRANRGMPIRECCRAARIPEDVRYRPKRWQQRVLQDPCT
jgi:hypothetical protein